MDALGLYYTVIVTLPNGSQYIPQTVVKNSAQAGSYGVPIGTSVPIAVPNSVDPQALVNQWSNSATFNGNLEFASFWMPYGTNDYKLIDPKYDAFGNFEYGATGAAQGHYCTTLTDVGDFYHGGRNYPINTTDIISGFNAVTMHGTLSTLYIPDRKPPVPIQ